MTEVYVVIGRLVDWEDFEEWPVRALSNEGDALALADYLNTSAKLAADEISKLRPLAWPNEGGYNESIAKQIEAIKESEPLDPGRRVYPFSHPPTYRVETVPFGAVAIPASVTDDQAA